MRVPRRLDYGDRVTLVEHLDELRTRLIVALAALAVVFGFTYGFRHHIIGWLNDPLPPTIDKRPLTISPLEPFLTSLTVSFYAALAIAFPILIWQIWAFLAPAMERTSQRTIARLVIIAGILMAGGIAFARFVVLPAAIPFLLGYDSELYRIDIRAKEYYSFAVLTIFSVGILFELPIFLLGLVRLGVLTATKLRKNRRIGIAVLTALSVALPGIDPITTIMQTIPLLVLFEASIWAAVILEKRWESQSKWADQWDEPAEPLTGAGEP